MNSMSRLLCTFSILLLATLVACGDSDDSVSEAAATPAAVPQAADAANAPSLGSANSPILQGSLPDNFPEDVPVYETADIAFSRSSPDFAVAGRFYSDDGPDQVKAYYADDFSGKGWDIEIRETPDGSMIIADKMGRKAAATITVNAQGRTQVDIMVTELPR